MPMDQLTRMLLHARWADFRLLDGLGAMADVPPAVAREMNHVIGAEETWLSRLEGRPSRVVVWPDLALGEARELAASVHDGLVGWIERSSPSRLESPVSYTNSAGQAFATPARDILLQVTLHGQYHRGKINRMLRDAGLEPVPVDYIYYVRGVPAATTRSR